MLYLSDVDHDSPCFSISPEAETDPVLPIPEQQLARGGIVNLEGPAGTAAMFNLSVLHAATVRPCTRERKSVQVYYGHRVFAPGDKGTIEGWMLKLKHGHVNSGGIRTPPLEGTDEEVEREAAARVETLDAVPRLSDYTKVPPQLRQHRDAEARAFYGALPEAQQQASL